MPCLRAKAVAKDARARARKEAADEGEADATVVEADKAGVMLANSRACVGIAARSVTNRATAGLELEAKAKAAMARVRITVGVIPLGFKLKVGKNQAYAYIDSTYLSEEKSLCRYGVVIFVNMCCVFELSRRLMDWVLSSTEAEFCALACGAQECLYIRYVLEAINEPQNGPLLIGQDNKSCIQIAENPGRHHGRTKHIDVRYRWIECKIYHAKIALVYVNTKHMVADSQTKALCYEAHATMASAMKGQKFPEKQKKEHKKRKLDEDDEVTINWVLPENQACQRADCPCTSRCVVINADGSVRRRHPYCCRTCARGRPCARNYHPTPIVVNEHDERVGTEET